MKNTCPVLFAAFAVSLGLLTVTAFGQGSPPAWLKDAQTPPAGQPAEMIIDTLLAGEDGKAFTTVAEWEKRRTGLREAWIKYLGPMASVREKGKKYEPPPFEVLEEVELDGIIRKKVLYTTEPGQHVRAYLMMPQKMETPCPAVVVFHGTNEYSYHQTAGVFDTGVRATGYHLARKGYVTICPQNCLWPCSDEIQLAYREVTKQFRERNPDNWGMARMILDAQIAVDILVSLDEVDPQRIGCTGHSLGGKQALYLPAFDERVSCSVSSEGGIGMEQSNWEADWYLGPPSKEAGFPLHHREILAMIAPRPFLLIGGDDSDGDASWPCIAAAMPVYRLYGTPPCLGLFNHKKGHALPPEAEKTTYEWFDSFLVPQELCQ
ncbi:MAG: acetylxylan esterase [Planctomycetaceae bacterium]|nr:acetylxylan esterase [Planctomycetaceae bacterium]